MEFSTKVIEKMAEIMLGEMEKTGQLPESMNRLIRQLQVEYS